MNSHMYNLCHGWPTKHLRSCCRECLNTHWKLWMLQMHQNSLGRTLSTMHWQKVICKLSLVQCMETGVLKRI